MTLAAPDEQACKARVRAYFESFHRGDSQAYADQWVFPGSVYSQGEWRQIADRAACIAGNDAYYETAIQQGMASGEIEDLQVMALGSAAAIVEGCFSRRRSDGSLISRIEAAYLVVRCDDGWKVAVCVVKDV